MKPHLEFDLPYRAAAVEAVCDLLGEPQHRCHQPPFAPLVRHRQRIDDHASDSRDPQTLLRRTLRMIEGYAVVTTKKSVREIEPVAQTSSFTILID